MDCRKDLVAPKMPATSFPSPALIIDDFPGPLFLSIFFLLRLLFVCLDGSCSWVKAHAVTMKNYEIQIVLCRIEQFRRI